MSNSVIKFSINKSNMVVKNIKTKKFLFQIDWNKKKVTVHFQGWNSTYDRTMDMYDREAIRGFTKRPTKQTKFEKKVC